MRTRKQDDKNYVDRFSGFGINDCEVDFLQLLVDTANIPTNVPPWEKIFFHQSQTWHDKLKGKILEWNMSSASRFRLAGTSINLLVSILRRNTRSRTDDYFQESRLFQIEGDWFDWIIESAFFTPTLWFRKYCQRNKVFMKILSRAKIYFVNSQRISKQANVKYFHSEFQMIFH